MSPIKIEALSGYQGWEGLGGPTLWTGKASCLGF